MPSVIQLIFLDNALGNSVKSKVRDNSLAQRCEFMRVCSLYLSLFQSELDCVCVHLPQLIVAGCSSLPCSNIRACRHLGPVVWALRGGNRLATGPDYFLHSPELNSVYAINQLHAV